MPIPSEQTPEPEPAAIEPEPTATRAGPEVIPEASVVVRRRTPVYGVWHSSRTTARQRVVAKEGTTVPRAYYAVRHRSGSFVAIVSTVAPLQAEAEIVRPVAAEPPAPAPPVLDVRPPVEPESEPRRSRRRDARRVDAPGVSRKRRLWDLLMAIVLIAALIMTVFLISRG